MTKEMKLDGFDSASSNSHSSDSERWKFRLFHRGFFHGSSVRKSKRKGFNKEEKIRKKELTENQAEDVNVQAKRKYGVVSTNLDSKSCGLRPEEQRGILIHNTRVNPRKDSRELLSDKVRAREVLKDKKGLKITKESDSAEVIGAKSASTVEFQSKHLFHGNEKGIESNINNSQLNSNNKSKSRSRSSLLPDFDFSKLKAIFRKRSYAASACDVSKTRRSFREEKIGNHIQDKTLISLSPHCSARSLTAADDDDDDDDDDCDEVNDTRSSYPRRHNLNASYRRSRQSLIFPNSIEISSISAKKRAKTVEVLKFGESDENVVKKERKRSSKTHLLPVGVSFHQVQSCTSIPLSVSKQETVEFTLKSYSVDDILSNTSSYEDLDEDYLSVASSEDLLHSAVILRRESYEDRAVESTVDMNANLSTETETHPGHSADRMKPLISDNGKQSEVSCNQPVGKTRKNKQDCAGFSNENKTRPFPNILKTSQPDSLSLKLEATTKKTKPEFTTTTSTCKELDVCTDLKGYEETTSKVVCCEHGVVVGAAEITRSAREHSVNSDFNENLGSYCMSEEKNITFETSGANSSVNNRFEKYSNLVDGTLNITSRKFSSTHAITTLTSELNSDEHVEFSCAANAGYQSLFSRASGMFQDAVSIVSSMVSQPTHFNDACRLDSEEKTSQLQASNTTTAAETFSWCSECNGHSMQMGDIICDKKNHRKLGSDLALDHEEVLVILGNQNNEGRKLPRSSRRPASLDLPGIINNECNHNQNRRTSAPIPVPKSPKPMRKFSYFTEKTRSKSPCMLCHFVDDQPQSTCSMENISVNSSVSSTSSANSPVIILSPANEGNASPNGVDITAVSTNLDGVSSDSEGSEKCAAPCEVRTSLAATDSESVVWRRRKQGRRHDTYKRHSYCGPDRSDTFLGDVSRDRTSTESSGSSTKASSPAEGRISQLTNMNRSHSLPKIGKEERQMVHRCTSREECNGNEDDVFVDAPVAFAQALWDHVSMNPEEICLHAGEVITVIDNSDKEWWWGTVEQRQGWFPAAFVRVRISRKLDDECEQESDSSSDEEVSEELIPSEVLRKREKIQSKVIDEILNTEKVYVKNLQDLAEGYLRQARKRPDMFTEEQISTIFSNIEHIYSFHKSFLHSLSQSYIHGSSHLSHIGAVFLQHREGFEIYSVYCNNHPHACAEIATLCQNNKYMHFFEACRLLQQMINISLDGFLLTPIQKICKYPLQLAELLKYTSPDHEDYDNVKLALDAMKRVASAVNESRRKVENIGEIARWQKSIEAWEGEDVLDQSSELIFSGDVQKISKGKMNDRKFFLFDHQLVYCRKDILKKSALIYKGRIDMDSSQVTSLQDGEVSHNGSVINNAWRIITGDNEEFIVVTKTSDEKQQWMKAFTHERTRVQEDQKLGLVIPLSVRKAAMEAAQERRKSKRSIEKRERRLRSKTVLVSSEQISAVSGSTDSTNSDSNEKSKPRRSSLLIRSSSLRRSFGRRKKEEKEN